MCIDPEQETFRIMNKNYSFRTKTLILSTLISVFILLGTACVAPTEPANTTQTNANVNPSANANTANAANTETGENTYRLPVTLPILDAMFYDEGFAEELKNKLQLNDQQIEQLRKVAGEAVGNLGEEENGDYSGSTRAATKRAEDRIREVLGEEKSNQLFELVRNRWTNGEVPLTAATKPNAVPTDTRIVVNAPAYRMDVFQDGKLIKTYKIGIGYPEFPLPSGMRKADTIIFNPTWTPPDEPWVKGKVQPGKKVEAGSKLNPLGPIKIPIGLPSLIHGGKNPARLGTFASHGCVGLTNAQVQDFSQMLAQISGTELTAEDVKNYEKQKTETKNFKLNNPVSVELRYETIVVEDGKLKIYRDVYERGTNTVENLRRVLDAHGVSYDSLSEPDRQKIITALNDMNKDAQGNPIVENVETASGNTNVNAQNQNSNSAKNDSNSNSGNVTKNIKGSKETAIELAQLQAKGYPAPVNLNAGDK